MRFPNWRYRYDGTDLLMAAAAGCVLGALSMFVFDPQHGRRRRALMRDKMVQYGNEISDYASGTAKDLRNRAQGVAAETRGMVRESLATEAGSQPSTPL